MGGNNESYVQFYFLGSADSCNFSFLQSAEKLALKVEIQFCDLIQKNSSSVCLFKFPTDLSVAPVNAPFS
jgi:hypothetical protein